MSGDLDFFEGSEKLLEIWWDPTPKLTGQAKNADLRIIPRYFNIFPTFSHLKNILKPITMLCVKFDWRLLLNTVYTKVVWPCFMYYAIINY